MSEEKAASPLEVGRVQARPSPAPRSAPTSRAPRSTYREPFVGGGAMFWEVGGPNSVLSDANAELITTYCAIRDHVDAVVAELRTMPNDKDYFHMVRARDPAHMGVVQVAARMIYLNKTCTNGLYRVNSRASSTRRSATTRTRASATSLAYVRARPRCKAFGSLLRTSSGRSSARSLATSCSWIRPTFRRLLRRRSWVIRRAGSHNKAPVQARTVAGKLAQGGLFAATSVSGRKRPPGRRPISSAWSVCSASLTSVACSGCSRIATRTTRAPFTLAGT